jgi:hypothetical protein
MKNQEGGKTNTGKIAFYSTISVLIFAFIYIFFGDSGNSVGIDEMLKHVHTGEVPF